MHISAVDIAALVILAFYIVRGTVVGLWPLLRSLISLAIGVYVALLLYIPLGTYIANVQNLPPQICDAGVFIATMLIMHGLVSWLLQLLMQRYPDFFKENAYTRGAAVIPAAVDGIILIALLVIVSGVLPLPAQYADEIANSSTGSFVNKSIPEVTKILNVLTFGGIDRAVQTLTSHAESNEKPETLTVTPSRTSIDTAGEAQMLALVNQERAKAGVGPLTLDPQLTAVARAHSQDMWTRKYFNHIDPDGKSPADRLDAAGIPYQEAGENIALAPTVAIAHQGLMNSPGHRANILNPQFHKVGIGIISGGILGEMVSQEFTN